MKQKMLSLTSFLVAGLFVLSVCFLAEGEVAAQTKSRRRTRTRPVVTNPPIAPANEEEAPADEPKIVRTADENTETEQEPTTTSSKSTSKKKAASANDKEEMQDTINALSNQVERLNDKLSEMQDNDKILLEMERLTRAEQRTENLRAQLVEVEGKLADLQAKLEQIDYALKPENIERVTQGYGTTRPEEARDSRRKQLESERNRTLAQVRILETSKQRLEASLLTADAEVDRLRRRLELVEQQEIIKSESGSSKNRKP